MPSLSEMQSASMSRITRAIAWSIWHCPPNPNDVRFRSATRAHVAGQVVAGEAAQPCSRRNCPTCSNFGFCSAATRKKGSGGGGEGGSERVQDGAVGD